MNQVFIALGANLGNKIQNINNSISLMRSILDIKNIDVAPFYLSIPLQDSSVNQGIDVKYFVNSVMVGYCSHSPLELLRGLKFIESQIGRMPSVHKWSSRPIDLDILLFNNLIFRTSKLTIPHIEMLKRDFVLEPLCDLAPSLAHPIITKSFAKLKQYTKLRSVTKKFRM